MSEIMNNKKYRSALYRKKGLMERILVRLFFSRIKVDFQQEQLTNLGENQRLIFALTGSRLIDFWLLSYTLELHGFPPLQFGTGISSFFTFSFREVIKRTARYLFGRSKVFFSRNDMANYCLENNLPFALNLVGRQKRKGRYAANLTRILRLTVIKSKRSQSVFICPVIFLWVKKTEKHNQNIFYELLFGTPLEPTLFRKMGILLRPFKSGAIRSLSPIDIRAQLNDLSVGRTYEGALRLRSSIMDAINEEKRIILGPTFRSTRMIIDTLLTSPDMQEFLRSYTYKNGIPYRKAFKKAEEELKVLVADYNFNYLRGLSRSLEFIWNNIFDGMVLKKEHLEKVKEAMKKAPCVFIPSHKSYVDFLIFSQSFLNNDISPPHIAAGVNLNFWPAGPIFKRCGAFFIKRTFKGDELYKELFIRYIQYLLDNHYSIEFFIEGTRSRTGKLMSPKFGMLSMIMDAHSKNPDQDLFIFPVGISFDQILDMAGHIKEQKGMEKAKESPLELIRARKLLSKKYGKVYVEIADPYNLKDMIKQPELKQLPKEDQVQVIAHTICKSINQHIIITPISLVCITFLGSISPALTRKEIINKCIHLINYSIENHFTITDELKEKTHQSLDTAITQLINNHLLELQEDLLLIHPEARLEAQYYVFSVLPFFIPSIYGILALKKSIFDNTYSHEDFKKNLQSIIDFFNWDFHAIPFDPLDRISKDYIQKVFNVKKIDKIFSKFTVEEMNAIIQNPSEDFVSDRILISLLESYMIVLQLLLKEESHTSIEEKDFINQCVKLSYKMLLRSEIQKPEAISTLAFKSAIDHLIHRYILIREQLGDRRKTLSIINRDELQNFSRTVHLYLHLTKEWKASSIIF